jgi:uncharacterized delta-60 repeat protein
MKNLSIALSLALVSALSGAELKSVDMTNDWQKTFGGTKKDRAYDVAPTHDGGAVVVGGCKSFSQGRTDACILKMDAKGNILWTKSYGGKKRDSANAVVETTDGNIVVVGNSMSYSEDGDSDVFVLKLNQQGKVLWKHTYGGSENEVGNGVDAIANGGVIIAGLTESYGQGNEDVYFLKLNANGKVLAESAIGGSGDDYASAIARTNDGNYVLGGASESFGDNGFDFYYIKLSPSGALLWEKTLGGENDDIIYDLVSAGGKGDFAFAGMTKSYGSKHKDLTVLKMNKDGNNYWHKIFGFKSKEYANSLVTTKDGGFVVAGTTKSFGMGKYDFYIIRLNNRGNLIWANVYGNEERDIAHGVTQLNNGQFIVVGQTDSYGKGSDDFFMMNLRNK